MIATKDTTGAGNDPEALELADLLIGDDAALEFSTLDFDQIDGDGERTTRETRYKKPVFDTRPLFVEYTHAKEAALAVSLSPGQQMHFIVPGNFIFGDFIEALLVEKNVKAQEAYVATLSLSAENVDSLAGLLQNGFMDSLVLCVSNYFYSHERHGLVPYLLDALDNGTDRFQCIVTRSHMKIVLLDVGAYKIVITGSANLRSSNSAEQFTIQDSPELYAFYKAWLDDRGTVYAIIDHSKPKPAPGDPEQPGETTEGKT